MNAIELLSAKYNFPVEEAMTLFTTKPNKNTKKNAKKEGQSLQDMFAELVNDVEQDNRGPVIETVVVETAPVDELKKLMMASEKKEALAAMKEQKRFDDLAAKEVAKKQKEEEKAAAKEALLKQKEEEKAALLKQKEEEKAAAKAALLKQKEEEKAAAKEALLKQKEEEKAALKKQKDEEKAALKEPKVVKEKVVKEPKAKAEKVVKEKVVKEKKTTAKKTKDDYSPERQSPAFLPTPTELPPVKVTVTRIKIDDQTYLKSAAGILYNAETKEEVGLHDEATNTIKPLPDDEEEELEEDEYAEDN